MDPCGDGGLARLLATPPNGTGNKDGMNTAGSFPPTVYVLALGIQVSGL